MTDRSFEAISFRRRSGRSTPTAANSNRPAGIRRSLNGMRRGDKDGAGYLVPPRKARVSYLPRLDSHLTAMSVVGLRQISPNRSVVLIR